VPELNSYKRIRPQPFKYGSPCYLLHTALLLDLFFGSENEGKMFCETLDDCQRTTRRYILEDRTPQKYFSLYQAAPFYMKQRQSPLQIFSLTNRKYHFVAMATFRIEL
jgi:hypothetical protein